MPKAENPRAVVGSNTVAADLIKSFIERVERLEEDEAAVRDDKKDVYAEAKGNGLDVKALKTLVSMRKKDKDKLIAEREIVELYGTAIGMSIFD